MMENISFRLNGKPISLTVDTDRNLLSVLRTDLGQTGTKYGCGSGFCGACTVIVDNQAVQSCRYAVRKVANREVLTIEGLATNGKLHPLQEAFVDHDALQCGYCTPGMIMNAYGMLLNNPQPSRAEIIAGMNDHLCRCSAYNRIIEAIETAGQKMKGVI